MAWPDLTNDLIVGGEGEDNFLFRLKARTETLRAVEYLTHGAHSDLTGERAATDTLTIAWDWATAGQGKANVVDNSITDAKLRQGAALSIIGRAANSTGNVADIAAAANDRILARTADALGFVQLTLGMFPDGVLTFAKLNSAVYDTDGTLAGNSDTKLPTQKAVKTYVDQIVAANDAMVFKGVIDCAANPNYPAADRGHTYRVSVAGKIGGGSGVNVEAGDLLLCLTDATASGNHATVGANWTVGQTNIDGAVVGPASATDGDIARFDGTSGKLIKAGVSLDTDGTMAANSATHVPSQSAVVTYVAAAIAALRNGVSAAYDTLAEIATDLATRALQATTISGGGLATGGGSLAANRTITVTAASDAETRALTETGKALTPSNLAARARFLATLSANQTGVADGATVKVTLNAETFDVGGYFDTTNNRWTPPAGPVRLSAKVVASGVKTNGGVQAIIFKNGALLPVVGGGSYFPLTTTNSSVSVIDSANGTDYYELFIYADATTTVTVQSSSTHFCGEQI